MNISPSVKRWAVGSFAALVIALSSALGLHYEGMRYQAYWDAAGHTWTICAGHTAGVKQGDTASDAQCRAWIARDYGNAYSVVSRCIRAPLTLGQAAAFTDAVYNLGPQVVCGSTLQRLANAGDLNAACDQLPRWNKAGGQILNGLTARRGDERTLCKEGVR